MILLECQTKYDTKCEDTYKWVLYKEIEGHDYVLLFFLVFQCLLYQDRIQARMQHLLFPAMFHHLQDIIWKPVLNIIQVIIIICVSINTISPIILFDINTTITTRTVCEEAKPSYNGYGTPKCHQEPKQNCKQVRPPVKVKSKFNKFAISKLRVVKICVKMWENICRWQSKPPARAVSRWPRHWTVMQCMPTFSVSFYFHFRHLSCTTRIVA